MSSCAIIDVDLTAHRGVVIQQRARKAEAAVSIAASVVGVPNPYEVKNFYSILALPEHVTVAKPNKDEENLWAPTFEDIQKLPVLFVLREESDSCSRGGAMRIAPPRTADDVSGRSSRAAIGPYLSKGQRRQKKQCNRGDHHKDQEALQMWWMHLLSPFAMTLLEGDAARVVGHVEENFDPYCNKNHQFCCNCSSYHRIYATTVDQRVAPASFTMHRFTDINAGMTPSVEFNFHLCCCSGQSDSNNCCRATCCNHNMIFCHPCPDQWCCYCRQCPDVICCVHCCGEWLNVDDASVDSVRMPFSFPNAVRRRSACC